MSNTAASLSRTVDDRRELLRHALKHATHLLPAQGPIGVFIHHNTLHAFQHLHFEDAVCEASKVFATEPFLREEVYREHLRNQRIRIEDIETVLDREPTEAILPNRLDRRTLRKQLLIAGPRRFEAATVQWNLEESDLLQSLRPDANQNLAARLKAGSGEEAGLRELFEVCQVVAQPEAPPARSLSSAR